MSDLSANQARIVDAGNLARCEDVPIELCPYGVTDMNRRHLWLAGWNDADMALSRRG